ncbi:hypothetical protein D3C80_1052360 [compost metagenome]
MLINFGVTLIGLGICRIVLHQRIANVIDVNQRIIRGHPRVRVGFAVIRPFAYPHWRDPFRDFHFWHAFQMLEETLEPQLQVHAIRQNQLCILRAFDVAGRGLVFVDFCARFGNRGDFRGVPRDVFRHISNDGKRGDHPEFFSRQCPGGAHRREQYAEQHLFKSLPWSHRESLLRWLNSKRN